MLWTASEHIVFLSYTLTFFLLRSILECEKLVKETYQKNGLVYKESSSEDEGGGGGVLSSEVIEIDDDDDDDVIAVGCCESCSFQLHLHCYFDVKSNPVVKYLLFCRFQWFLQRSRSLPAKIQW